MGQLKHGIGSAVGGIIIDKENLKLVTIRER